MFFPSMRHLVNELTRHRSRKAGLKRPARRFRPNLENLESLTLPSTVNWIGGSGNWNDASHWLEATTMTNHVPGATDDAVIGVAGVTVTHGTGSDTVNSLTISDNLNATFVLSGDTLSVTSSSAVGSMNAFIMSSGTLTGTGTLTLRGLLMWAGGTMTGSGTTVASGGLALSGDNGGEVLDGRTLDNHGTATWAGQNNQIYLSNGATWHNEPGAVLDSQADGQQLGYNGGATPSVVNQGTLKKSAGSGTLTVSVALTNSGTVSVLSGTLSLAGGGSSGGAFAVSAGATLNFANGTHTLAAGSSISGAGSVTFTGADVTLNGTFTATGRTTVSGGPATFNSNTTFTSLTVSSGTLGGTGTLTVSGLLTWTGGTMTGSGTTVASGGLALSGDNGGEVLDGRTLDNRGTATWAGQSNQIYLSNGATWHNEPGAVLDSQADGQQLGYNGGVAPAVVNQGTLKKSAGSGTLTVSVALTNSGTVAVQTGTLSLAGGGGSSSAFSVSTGASLSLPGNTYTLNAGASVSGGGILMLSGATLTVAADLSIPNLTFNGGTLNGSGTLTVSGLLTWTGGTMTGSGTTVASGGLALSGDNGGEVLDGRTLDNHGTATWAGQNNQIYLSNGATWHNEPGAVLDSQADGQQLGYNGGATPSVVNQGTLKKSAGSGTLTVSVALTNSGTVSVLSGTLSLAGGGFSNFSGTTLTGGTYLVTGTLQFTGANIVTNAATIVLDGPASKILDQSNADALANFAANTMGSQFTVQNGRNFTTASDFRNDGTLTVGAGSSFTITGNLANFSGTTLGSGTYAVAGTFRFTNADIRANAAAVTLIGSAAQIVNQSGANGLVNLAANTGSLIFTGHDFTTAGAFSNTGTLTIGVSTTLTVAGAYTQAAGTLTGPGSLIVNGRLTWTGGTMSGTGRTRANGGLTLDGSGSKTLDGRILENAGQATWIGTGNLVLANAAVVNNLMNAVFDVQTDAALTGSGTVTNAGTFLKSAGTGTSLGVLFNNSGSVSVQSGILNLAGGGTGSGSWTVAPTATLQFTAGNYALNTGTTFAGAGLVQVSGAAVTLNTALSAVNLALASGSFNGSGNLTSTGSFLWTGGTLGGPGTLTISPTSTLSLSGPGDKTLQRPLANAGTVAWFDGGRLILGSGGSITNQSGALLDARGDAALTGSGIVTNAGTFRKSAGTATTLVQAAFSNSGTVDVSAGTLFLSGTFTNFAGTTLTGGTYRITGTLQFTNANIISNAATIVLGGPAAKVFDQTNNNGLANFVNNTMAGSFSVQNGFNFTMPGNFNNDGAVTIGSGSSFTMTGSLTQTGSLNVQAGGTLSLQGGGTSSGPLNNDGAVTINSGTLFSEGGAYTETGTLEVQAGAELDLLGGGSGSGSLSDDGTLVVGAGSSFTENGSYGQTGTLTVQAGATLVLAGTFANFDGATLTGGTYDILGTFQFAGAAVVTNAATLIVDGPGAQILDTQGNDALANSFAANAGSLTLQNGYPLLAVPSDFSNTGSLSVGPGSTFDTPGVYSQTAGSTTLNGGTLEADGLVDLEGGLLNGAGTLQGTVLNNAAIAVGQPGSPGVLMITGDYSGSGTLVLEIGGTNPGTDFDQLMIGGQATFAGGTLTINLINGFQPNPSNPDSFQVLTFGAHDPADDFAVYNGLDLGNGLSLAPTYDSGSLTLVATSSGGAPRVPGQEPRDHRFAAAEAATPAVAHLALELAGRDRFFAGEGEAYRMLNFGSRSGGIAVRDLADLGAGFFPDPALDDTGLTLPSWAQ